MKGNVRKQKREIDDKRRMVSSTDRMCLHYQLYKCLGIDKSEELSRGMVWESLEEEKVEEIISSRHHTDDSQR
jgi:hypothetical protein